MKKLFFVLLVVLLPALSQAQNNNGPATYRNFSLGFDLYTDFWQNLPDAVDQKGLNRSVNVYLLYNNQIGQSRFNFSYGLNLNSNNLYLNGLPVDNNWKTEFVKFNDTLSYSKAKLNLTYLDVPLEISYRAKSGFQFYAGIRLGFLLSAHTKYKGEDPSGLGYDVVIKRDDVRYLNLWRYVAYARIGYKWINLYGSYQLNPTFKDGEGPNMFPISVGLGITPY